MRLGPAATVGALLSLALFLPACGDGGSASGGPSQVSAPKADPVGVRLAIRQCQGQLRPFLHSLDALRKKLAVGVNYDEYLRQLHGVKADYDGIRAGDLQLGCLTAVGGPGERALNRYIGAANLWGACIADLACETESIEPKLQHRWARASELLSVARSGF